MTLLTVVKDVCADVGVEIPASVFTGIGSNRTMQEMVALANEMAQRIAYDTRDWTRLRVVTLPPTMPPFIGDGVTTAFPLPANYKRMLKTANVWRSTSSQQPMRFIPDTDQWIQRRLANNTDSWGEWTIIGNSMHIWPAMGVGTTATFVYLDRNCIALGAGGFGDRFIADNDSFVLDERLLKLSMIWQWKAKKGGAYAEDMGTYQDAILIAMGNDSPAPTIVGRTPISANAKVAYPWPVPT